MRRSASALYGPDVLPEQGIDLTTSQRPLVLTVFGTRPEAIKLAPVVMALRESQLLTVQTCVTAQHREMLDQILGLFQIEPDIDLDLMTPEQSLPKLTSVVLERFTGVLKATHPALVLVQGDTTTAMVASLAAFYERIPIGHVEAGLRTYDTAAPFPEEANRQVIRVVGDYHFAPTRLAAAHLAEERVPAERILITGNTGVDAVLQALVRARRDGEPRGDAWAFLKPGTRLVLITGHRRESFGQPFRRICEAFRDLALRFPDVQFVYPVHLNPNVRRPVTEMLEAGRLPNFHLVQPQDYLPFVALMDRASLIITDSGGIQEEALSVGKPVLVTREVTERPEGLETGLVRLVGTDRQKIVDECAALLENRMQIPVVRTNPYGDGRASERIVAFLERTLAPESGQLHPGPPPFA